MGQYHGIQQTMFPNHVLDLSHLWLNPESRLTLTIHPLNLTWSNHQPPSMFCWGILHTCPYPLGLFLDFTGELPGVCMPYQVLQTYSHLHANLSITLFLCVFMVTTPSPSVASSSCFCMLTFLLVYLLIFYHALSKHASNFVIDVHIKMNPSTRLHGSSIIVNASSIGILITYMDH